MNLIILQHQPRCRNMLHGTIRRWHLDACQFRRQHTSVNEFIWPCASRHKFMSRKGTTPILVSQCFPEDISESLNGLELRPNNFPRLDYRPLYTHTKAFQAVPHKEATNLHSATHESNSNSQTWMPCWPDTNLSRTARIGHSQFLCQTYNH